MSQYWSNQIDLTKAFPGNLVELVTILGSAGFLTECPAQQKYDYIIIYPVMPF